MKVTTKEATSIMDRLKERLLRAGVHRLRPQRGDPVLAFYVDIKAS